jgi:serine/threonine protein kinase
MEEEEEAGWRECVVHRDLKPDNMLLTKGWMLKLTDFGEARATNMGATMTSVGTPIYIAPEVMRADHYDVKADTWSFGLCLVAMIRAEKNIQEFFYQCLRYISTNSNRIIPLLPSASGSTKNAKIPWGWEWGR